MRIFQSDAFGGTYTAPLALNVKAVFTPVSGDPSGRREVTRRIDLGPGSNSVWAYVNLPRYKQGVRVDTNGDGRPDTALPASSNFLAGVSPAVLKEAPALPRLASKVSGSRSASISCPAGPVPLSVLPLRRAGYQSPVEPVGHRMRRRTTSTASGPAPRPRRSPACGPSDDYACAAIAPE